MPDHPHRLYIDATIGTPMGSRATVSFGPFALRDTAKQALIAFMAREHAYGAVIRDPDGDHA